MSKLYVLPNGMAVDPDTVTSVTWAEKNSEHNIKDRVIVYMNRTPGALVVDYETLEEAKAACLEIIAGINELRDLL